MNRLYVLVALAPVVLVGCATGFPGARPLTYATPGEARVFATGQRCVHQTNKEEFAGLVAAALTGAASQLLKNFGTALSEGAKGGALPSSTATLNLQLEVDTTPKCVVAIRGAFDPPEGKTSKDAIAMDVFLAVQGDADRKALLSSLKLPPIYRIDHYVEIGLLSSANSKALTFAPVYARIDRSIDGAKKGERDLSVAVKFNRAGETAVGSAIVIADRKVGAGGSTWAPDATTRYPIEAPWFGTFHAPPRPQGAEPAAGGGGGGKGAAAPAQTVNALPAAAPQAGGQRPPVGPAPAPADAAAPGQPAAPPVGEGGVGAGTGAGGAAAPKGGPQSPEPNMQSLSKDAVPVTLTVTVVETRPTNQSLAFIASVFSGLEPKIEETLKPLIDSDARAKADAAESTADLGALADYAVAEGAARAALITYCKAASADSAAAGQVDRINKSKDARSSQLKANVAAIKAEVDQPYSVLITISSEAPATANSSGCSGT